MPKPAVRNRLGSFANTRCTPVPVWLRTTYGKPSTSRKRPGGIAILGIVILRAWCGTLKLPEFLSCGVASSSTIPVGLYWLMSSKDLRFVTILLRSFLLILGIPRPLVFLHSRTKLLTFG